MNGLSIEARIFSLHTFSLSLLNQFSTIISMITLIACTYVCNSSNMCMTNLPDMYAHARPKGQSLGNAYQANHTCSTTYIIIMYIGNGILWAHSVYIEIC